MTLLSGREYKLYSNFLNTLAKDLNKFYYSKLNKTFKILSQHPTKLLKNLLD